MRAILTDGSSVVLEKDCGCITHEGPHWLHMDEVDRGLNARMLERGNTRGFAQSEAKRLESKAFAMEARHITKIYD